MSDGAGGGPQLGWGGALLLTGAALFGPIVDPVPLVLLPLALLLVGLPPRRAVWLVAGIGLWLLAAVLGGGALGEVGLAWASVLAGAFLGITWYRPAWSASSRVFGATAVGLGLCGVWLAATGRWAALDARFLEHFQTVAGQTVEQLRRSLPDAAWIEQFAAAAPQIARVQWTLYPALLALQSLAGLALAWWLLTRLRRADGDWRPLSAVREFRFNDQLIWLLIGGLLLVVLPQHELATRAGWNLMFFMGCLYALRGAAVFAFLAAGVPTVLSVALALFATVFLYPFVLTAALLVGLGDTWLDVRGRAAAAAR